MGRRTVATKDEDGVGEAQTKLIRWRRKGAEARRVGEVGRVQARAHARSWRPDRTVETDQTDVDIAIRSGSLPYC